MPKNNKSNLSPIAEHLINKEGIAPYIYADTKGLLTSGVGHLLTAADIKAANLTKYVTKTPNGYQIKPGKGLKTQTIENGYYTINEKGNKEYKPLHNAIVLNKQPFYVSEDNVFNTYNKDLDSKTKLTRSYIPNFDTLPINQQSALVAEVYRGSLSGSPKALKLIEQGRYNEAANEYLNNKEFKTTTEQGIKTRFENAANAIRNLGRQQRAEQTDPAAPMLAQEQQMPGIVNQYADMFQQQQAPMQYADLSPWNADNIFGNSLA